MFEVVSIPFEVERTRHGVRYVLPEQPPRPGARRTLGHSVLGGLALVAGVIALGYFGAWKLLVTIGLMTLPGALPALGPLARAWVQAHSHRTVITLHKRRLTTTLRGRLAWTSHPRELKRFRRLSVLWGFPEEDDSDAEAGAGAAATPGQGADAERATLLAEYWGEEPQVLAAGYPRAMLEALAYELAEHLREALGQAPGQEDGADVPVLVGDVAELEPEALEQPPFSRATVEREGEAVVVSVPRAPVGSLMRRRVGSVWLLVVIWVLGLLGVLAWGAIWMTTRYGGSYPLAFGLAGAALLAVVGLPLLRWRSMRKQPTLIDASPVGLVVTAPAWLGVSQLVLPVEQIHAIEAQPPTTNDAPCLVIRRPGWLRRPIRLFHDHDPAELEWLADLLAGALHGADLSDDDSPGSED